MVTIGVFVGKFGEYGLNESLNLRLLIDLYHATAYISVASLLSLEFCMSPHK